MEKWKGSTIGANTEHWKYYYWKYCVWNEFVYIFLHFLNISIFFPMKHTIFGNHL